MKTIYLLGVLLLCFTTLFSHHGIEGSMGINGTGSNQYLTLKKYNWLFDYRSNYWHFKQLNILNNPNSNYLDLNHIFGHNSVLAYGFSDKITLSYSIPFLIVQHWDIEGHKKIVSGFGDSQLSCIIASPSIFSAQWSLIVGTKLPTGTSSINDESLTTFSSKIIQPTIGFSVLKSINNWTLSGNSMVQLSYKNKVGRNNGISTSNQFYINYRPSKKCCSDSTITTDSLTTIKSRKIGFFIGAKQEYQQQARLNNSPTLNSGSNRLFSAFGINYFYNKTIVIPLLLELSIFEQLTGIQNQSDFRITTGIIVNLK